jgi:hypothetical protein
MVGTMEKWTAYRGNSVILNDKILLGNGVSSLAKLHVVASIVPCDRIPFCQDWYVDTRPILITSSGIKFWPILRLFFR